MVDARQEAPPALPAELSAYRITQWLGGGSFGDVWKAVNQQTLDVFALKVMNSVEPCATSQHSSSSSWVPVEVASSSIREVAILHRLRHPGIVKFCRVFCDPQSTYLLMEHMDTTLFDAIQQAYRGSGKQHGLPHGTQALYFKQILEALEHCHDHMVVHRDLKPHNLLVGNGGKVKLCDFGMARVIDMPARHTTRRVVSPLYRPPEIILAPVVVAQPSLDMWSAGAILAEMASGLPLLSPSGDYGEVSILMAIFKRLGTPVNVAAYQQLPFFASHPWPKFPPPARLAVDNLDPAALPVLEGLLQYDPLERVSAEEALEDPWLSGLPVV